MSLLYKKLLNLGLEKGIARFTCTTGGAETLTLATINVDVGQAVSIKWGDGGISNVTGDNTNLQHSYAGAGTWHITMTNCTAITDLKVTDTKFGCAAGNIGKLTGLTYLYLENLTGCTISVGEIGGLTSLTYICLNNLANCTIDAGEISSLTSLWYLRLQSIPSCTIDAGEIGSLPLVTNILLLVLPNCTIGAGEIGGMTQLIYLYLSSLPNCTMGADEIDTLNSLQTCILINSDNIALQAHLPVKVRTVTYENGLSQANVDALLAQMYADRATFTWATPSLDIAGDSNAAPSGVYQDGDPPDTGLEYVYELANDPEVEGFNTWSITYEGGSAP